MVNDIVSFLKLSRTAISLLSYQLKYWFEGITFYITRLLTIYTKNKH